MLQHSFFIVNNLYSSSTFLILALYSSRRPGENNIRHPEEAKPLCYSEGALRNTQDDQRIPLEKSKQTNSEVKFKLKSTNCLVAVNKTLLKVKNA